jgi:hypothetical protein
VLGALPPMDDSRLKDAIVNCYDLISFPYDRFRELVELPPSNRTRLAS